jgi:hypothetical protein
MSRPPLRIVRQGDPNRSWTENLRYSLDVFSPTGSLVEVLGRLSDLTVAQTAFLSAVVRFPEKRIFLCDGGRVIKRSDEKK